MQEAEAYARRRDKAESARCARERQLAAERDEFKLQVEGLRATAASMQACHLVVAIPVPCSIYLLSKMGINVMLPVLMPVHQSR